MRLPSDALLQHLPSYLSFSYLGVRYLFMAAPAKDSHCSLTLDEGYLLTATLPDLQRGIAPLGPPAPVQPPLLGMLLPATGSGLAWVAPPSSCPWPGGANLRSGGRARIGGPIGAIPR